MNRQQKNEYMRRYRAENRDRINARQRARRNATSENDRSQRFYRDNIERISAARAERYQQNRISSYKAGVNNSENAFVPILHSLGPLNIVCSNCQAVHFKGETNKCCHNGKVSLPLISHAFPPNLRELFTQNDERSKHFRKYIRHFNNSNAFASMGATSVDIPGNGPYCFKISGQVYHRTSETMPVNVELNPLAVANLTQSTLPKYADLYIYDSDTALEIRMKQELNKHCKIEIMGLIAEDLNSVSPYAAHYRNLRAEFSRELIRSRATGQQMRQIKLTFNRHPNDDKRVYNPPTTCEDIGAVFVMDRNGSLEGSIDFAVSPITSGQTKLQKLHFLSKHVDPMTFPLFFPRGDFGFTLNMPHSTNTTSVRNKITPLEYYAYRISTRRDQFNPLHWGGKLFQEYLVHAYCIYESNKINYIRTHQSDFRVESYAGLMDHLNNMGRDQNVRIGNVVILPSSYHGGPRFMANLYQNNMAIVRKFGRPDLFITFTCNPKWYEITNELQVFQSPSDRPDIVTRVFNSKLKEFIDDITKKNIFGNVIAFVYVVEHQKRGLPHAHCLFTLSQEDKIRTGDEVDSIISAEIPNQTTEPELCEIVLKQMVHGPFCNMNSKSICMSDGQCSKGFPKMFSDTTDASSDGYPIYKRRNNTNENHEVRNNIPIDNRWIVPYNKFLTKKYDAHINVELCSTVKAIKYIHKYMTKGTDCARIGLQDENGDSSLIHDEPTAYLNCRYVSAQEASWKLQELPIHGHSHTVFQLSIHEENGQAIYFHENREEEALRIANVASTSLTSYFKLNQEDTDAHNYFYQDIPIYYKFEKKKWIKRSVNSRFKDLTIGRIPTVSPRNIELYHLRLLLLAVKGREATSFNELYKHNNTTYLTYREAAKSRGLINDSNEWHECMKQAVEENMPCALRLLFVTIIVHNHPIDPLSLWNEFKIEMSEDFAHKGYDQETSLSISLAEIEAQLLKEGLSCFKIGLPDPSVDIDFNTDNSSGSNQTDISTISYNSLNNEQMYAAQHIFDSVLHNKEQKCFYIDGPGGSGKTYLYQTLIRMLSTRGLKTLTIAWTGIAANLLENGMTCHSAFNFSLDMSKIQSPRISASKKLFLKSFDLLIWDEAPMAPGTALESVDLIMRDITGKDMPFGGKVIVLGGDFRQVLPVINKGSRGKIVASTIKNSSIWKSFKIFNLNTNMRAAADPDFSQFVLNMGDGILSLPSNSITDNSIEIPDRFLTSDLVGDIFGHSFNINEVETLSKRAILTPKNESVRLINEKVLERLCGQQTVYKAIDSIKNDKGEEDIDQQIQFPVEFLNSLNPAGLPPHELNLKLGSIIMLLRNLSISKGLCNGTRMIVREMRPYIIKVEVITGSQSGSVHFIPRISLDTSNDPNIPFNFCRHQFPVRLAYAITINKAQGQTFDKVGVYLPEPCFGHGQLYTACSRATKGENLKIQILNGSKQGTKNQKTLTENIVYQEILK